MLSAVFGGLIRFSTWTEHRRFAHAVKSKMCTEYVFSHYRALQRTVATGNRDVVADFVRHNYSEPLLFRALKSWTFYIVVVASL